MQKSMNFFFLEKVEESAQHYFCVSKYQVREVRMSNCVEVGHNINRAWSHSDPRKSVQYKEVSL